MAMNDYSDASTWQIGNPRWERGFWKQRKQEQKEWEYRKFRIYMDDIETECKTMEDSQDEDAKILYEYLSNEQTNMP